VTATSPLALLEPLASAAGDLRAHTVEFAAHGTADTGPLTWAQQHILAIMEPMQPMTQSVNVPFSMTLRAGVTTDEVFDGLRGLLENHEALRSYYVPPPQGPAQRVESSGRLSVPVLDCPSEASARAIVSEVVSALAARPFDLCRDSPIRVALITADGAPSHLAFAASHLMVDATAAGGIKRYLRTRLLQPPAAAPSPQVPHQMLAEAQWELSPPGVRSGSRAIAHHQRTLMQMPQTMLPRRLEELPRPRYRYLEYESPALAHAISFLSARHKTAPATVVYAAITAVAGFVSGLPRAFLQLTLSNRLELRQRGAIGMYVQDVPVSVDLTDATVADVIVRSEPSVLEAVRFGRYPPADLAMARERIELRRGAAFDLSCWLNYMPTARLAPAEERPSARTLTEALARARWRWIDGPDSSTSTYFIFADGGSQSLVLTVIVDSALLPPDEAVAWLGAVDRVLCASVLGDVAVTEIGTHTELVPTPRSADWLLTDVGWVDLRDVTDLVRGITGAPQSDVLVVPATDGPRLTAFIDGSRLAPGQADPAWLHSACVAGLPGNRTAMAPHQYIISARPPRVRDITGWQRVPVLAEGTGRAPSPTC
jgi:hypothetical protein